MDTLLTDMFVLVKVLVDGQALLSTSLGKPSCRTVECGKCVSHECFDVIKKIGITVYLYTTYLAVRFLARLQSYNYIMTS